MYSIADYGEMIADSVRMDAFARALRAAVTPGAVVVDIGTGTGIFALLACRFGARRVYAIESGDAIRVAREIAAANGCADRITFMGGISTEVSLPERADVVIADIGGVLPWFQRHIPSMIDARRRFLAPGGVMIPHRDAAWAAVVEAPELYERFSKPWSDRPFGFDMDAARRTTTSTWRKRPVTRDHLMTDIRRWAVVEYGTVEEAHVRAQVTWTIARAGTAHGIGAGFDRSVAAGIELSNAPVASASLRPVMYGTAFFPWSEPVVMAPGDVVRVDLDARLVGNDYVWRWSTLVLDQGDSRHGKAAFTQSTVHALSLSRANLQKREASYTPALTEQGEVARFVLEGIARGAPLGEIASQVHATFPARFPRWESALGYVGDLAHQYG